MTGWQSVLGVLVGMFVGYGLIRALGDLSAHFDQKRAKRENDMRTAAFDAGTHAERERVRKLLRDVGTCDYHPGLHERYCGLVGCKNWKPYGDAMIVSAQQWNSERPQAPWKETT
jgi:hypothetical protein